MVDSLAEKSAEGEAGERSVTYFCDDPAAFLGALRGTEKYQNGVTGRLEKATKACLPGESPPLRTEAALVFEESREFKELFWSFMRNVVNLSYNPQRYNPEFITAFDEYSASTRILNSARERDERQATDSQRRAAHIKAAEELRKIGLVSSERVGRLVVSALLIFEGGDTYDAVLSRPENRDPVSNDVMGQYHFTPVEGEVIRRNMPGITSVGNSDLRKEEHQYRRVGLPTQGDSENTPFPPIH